MSIVSERGRVQVDDSSEIAVSLLHQLTDQELERFKEAFEALNRLHPAETDP